MTDDQRTTDQGTGERGTGEEARPEGHWRDIHELLHHDQYTPEDAAYLLGMDPDVIHQAAHRHELPAIFAGNNVLYIRRNDLVKWLEQR